MLAYVARRLLHLVPVLLGISFLVFLLVHLVPGDPVRIMLQDVGSPEQVARVRQQLLAGPVSALEAVRPARPRAVRKPDA